MSILLDNAKLFSSHTTYKDLIEGFKDRSLYNKIKLFSAWTSNGEYVRRKTFEISYHFLSENESLYNSYLNQEITLNKLAMELIRFIFLNKFTLDETSVINELNYGDKIVDRHILRHLSSLMPQKDHLDILGFGGGSGYYETNIAELLKEKNYITSYQVYVFDPYVSSDAKISGVTYISKFENIPSFDLIFARWVLHHVHLNDRWETLITAINFLKKQGRVLILEEGDINLTLESNIRLIYHFFLMVIDVVVNFSLRPQWLIDSKNQFFLSYLTPTDIDSIVKTIPFKIEQSISWISDGFFLPKHLIDLKRK